MHWLVVIPHRSCFSIFLHLPFHYEVRNYFIGQKRKLKDTDTSSQRSTAAVKPDRRNSHYIPVKPLDNPRVPFLGPSPKHSVTKQTK